MNKNKNQNKVIVITGASSGLGEALYEKWERRGNIVLSLSRTNPKGKEHFFPCDVTKEEEIKEAFSLIKKDYGHIDVLVSNAGFGLSGASELLEKKDVDNILSVNVLGDWLVTKYALPLMDKGSKILHISSVCALFPLCYRGIYCGSKAAQHMITLSSRMELKGQVDVVSICPADIKTNFTKNRVKVKATSSRYGDKVMRAMEKLDKREDRRMKVDKVASKIVSISEKRRTKPMYIIGFKMKLLYFAMRFLPLSYLLHWTEKIYGGH